MLIPDIFDREPRARPQRGILHVGAHQCEERELYKAIGMDDDKVAWVEANPAVIASVKSPPPHFWQAVVSNEDGKHVTFRITNNGQSSSLLPLKTHLTEHPGIVEVAHAETVTVTLNTLLRLKNVAPDTFDYMNLDVQGAELMVLQGATTLLPHIRAIYTEVNVRELYEGCALMHQLDAFLEPHGFHRTATYLTHHGWGDALYLKDVSDDV